MLSAKAAFEGFIAVAAQWRCVRAGTRHKRSQLRDALDQAPAKAPAALHAPAAAPDTAGSPCLRTTLGLCNAAAVTLREHTGGAPGAPPRGGAARIVVEPRAHRYESVVFASTSLSISLQLDNVKLARVRDKALPVQEQRYEGLRAMKPSALIMRCGVAQPAPCTWMRVTKRAMCTRVECLRVTVQDLQQIRSGGVPVGTAGTVGALCWRAS